MRNNQSFNLAENPIRGFAFVQFSNSFNNMLYHFNDDMEIACMSVRFPALRLKKAKAILRRSLRACREIVNCGIDLKSYMFQLTEDEMKRPTGVFRIIFLVPGNTVCPGVRLFDDLKNKLERHASGHPFDITLNRPVQDEYEGSLVFSPDNPQRAHAWLADCLWDTEECSWGEGRHRHLPKSSRHQSLAIG